MRTDLPNNPYVSNMMSFTNRLSSANENTLSANKKTIMPADVFKALDEIEYGFMREKLEAEFASSFSLLPSPTAPFLLLEPNIQILTL